MLLVSRTSLGVVVVCCVSMSPSFEGGGEVHQKELIRQADHAISQEQLLVAARLLRQLSSDAQSSSSSSLLTKEHHTVLKKATITENVISTHLKPPVLDAGWKKQTEVHGNRDTIIYYKVDDDDCSKLTCRIETPIEASLLVPLMAVFNESELYETWMPRFNVWPAAKVGVRESKKLQDQPARGAQVVQVTVDMPRPFISDREVVFESYAVDDIDAQGLIFLKGTSLEVGDHYYHHDDKDESLHVPPPLPGIKRLDFECGWVIRRCPDDHPALRKSKHKYPAKEHLLLLSLTQYVNAYVDWVPQWLINFFTRTALSGQWKSLLQVATDVKEGKRPDHAECIRNKQELYGWVNGRIQAMFDKLDNYSDNNKENGNA